MKKLKKSTKIILLTSVSCLLVAVALISAGLIGGISTWITLDFKSGMVTSKTAPVYEQSFESEPFTSVKISLPANTFRIVYGDKYSVEYSSCLPRVKPTVKLEDGTLSVTNEWKTRNVEILRLFTDLDAYPEERNFLTITVPDGTKLEGLELESIYFDGINPSYSIENMAIGTVTLNEGYTNNVLNISGSTIDTINMPSVWSSMTIQKSTVGTINIDYPTKFWSDSSIEISDCTVDVLNGKADIFETAPFETYDFENFVASNRSQFGTVVNCVISDSAFGAIDLFCDNFTMEGSTADSISLLSLGSVDITSYVPGANDVFKALDDIKISTRQQPDSFSYTLARSLGFNESIVTEKVPYGDEKYWSGYVTEEIENDGTELVEISQAAYDKYTSAYPQSDSETHYINKDLNADLIISTTEKYSEETADIKYYAEVYKAAMVSYYTNPDGTLVFVNPVSWEDSESSDEAVITVGTQSTSKLRISSDTGSSSSLNCYSRFGGVLLTYSN